MPATHPYDLVTGTAPTPPTEAPMSIPAYPPPTPHEDVDNQLPEFPEDWKPPSRPIFRLLFRATCRYLIGETSLEPLWQQVTQDNGWERFFVASCDSVTQITTAVSIPSILIHSLKD